MNVVPSSNSPKRKSDELNGEATNGDAEVKTEEDIPEEVRMFENNAILILQFFFSEWYEFFFFFFLELAV